MNNKEYEKDLNELKEQILKEGNTLVSKRDLLERFCEIDKEYNGSPWNLLQILSNIDVLIGQEFCEGCVSSSITKILSLLWKFNGGRSMMTLESAIKHCEEVAEEQEKLCKVNDSFNFSQPKWEECANEHRQLAEWLKELKESRMVLNKIRAEIDELDVLKYSSGERIYKDEVLDIIDKYKVESEDK